ncbi:uncharacterized protein TNCV_4463511 [Trichonephila clavipes]|nr:uncharacterized protein TNCV_4463511 [Trichonephila clavipes]
MFRDQVGRQFGDSSDHLGVVSDNIVVHQPMKARAYCPHPSIRDHWMLRCMSRYSDQVVSLKRDPQRLSPQASLVLIYRPTTVGMKD